MSLNQIKKLRQHLYKKLVKYSTTPLRNKAVNVCQFSSVQSLSCVQLFATPWTEARQASLSITNSRSLLKLMSIESVVPSNHLILCHPLLLLPSIFASVSINSINSLQSIKFVSQKRLRFQTQSVQRKERIEHEGPENELKDLN